MRFALSLTLLGVSLSSFAVTESVECALSRRDRFGSIGRVITKDGFTCTGTLLSPRVVLTAAHCAWRHFPDELSFILDGKNRAVVAEVALHPSFQLRPDGGPVGADLAVLKLRDTSYGKVPLRFLPGANAGKLSTGAVATVVGYGADEKGRGGLRRPREVVFEKMSDVTGKDGLRTANGVFLFKRGSTGETACVGDSGGPLLLSRGNELAILGVVSRSELPIAQELRTVPTESLHDPKFFCRSTQELFAVSVAAFFPWIEEKRSAFETIRTAAVCPP